MPALRILPRGFPRIRKDEPNDGIRIHVSSASHASDLSDLPKPRRRKTFRLPRWRRQTPLEEDENVQAYLSHTTPLIFGDASPSKTLCSISGTTAFGDGLSPWVRAKELSLSLLPEPVMDVEPLVSDSLLFHAPHEVPAPNHPSKRQSQPHEVLWKPLPPLPAPAPTSVPYPSSPISDISMELNVACNRPRSERSKSSNSFASSANPKHEQEPDDEELMRSAFFIPRTKIRNGKDVFTIEYLINVGGFGYVYRARSHRGEIVAIKVMAKEWLSNRLESLESAKTEFEVLRRVSEEGRHFMTQLLSSWADEDNIFFVMVCICSSISSFED